MSHCDLELYSNSIYCNTEKQCANRPFNWFATKAFKLSSLGKFSWLHIPTIVYEVSFKSAHTPIANTLIPPSEHFQYPLGVRTFKSENLLYWKNCALSYLLEYQHHLNEAKVYQGYLLYSPASHELYTKYLCSAKREASLARDKFKLCMRLKRRSFGMMTPSLLSDRIKSELVAFKLLEIFFKSLDHNVVLAGNCIESFLEKGFTIFNKFTFSKLPDSESFEYRFKLIRALLIEVCSRDQTMHLYFSLSFGQRYGSLNELDPISNSTYMADVKSRFMTLVEKFNQF